MDIIPREYQGNKIRQREDNYISATDMCKANGKLFAGWYRLESTKEYLEALSSVMQIPTSAENQGFQALVEIKKGGNPELQGTWVHRKVAIRLAQWLSPMFAIQVDTWVEELLLHGYTSTDQAKPAGNAYTRRLEITTERINLPDDYWSIFYECSLLMGTLEKHFPIDKLDLVDGSVGQRWGRYRREQAENGADWLRDRDKFVFGFG
jgi:hypothetical protein